MSHAIFIVDDFPENEEYDFLYGRYLTIDTSILQITLRFDYIITSQYFILYKLRLTTVY